MTTDETTVGAACPFCHHGNTCREPHPQSGLTQSGLTCTLAAGHVGDHVACHVRGQVTWPNTLGDSGPGTYCNGCRAEIRAGDKVWTEAPNTVQTYPTPKGHYYGGIYCAVDCSVNRPGGSR